MHTLLHNLVGTIDDFKAKTQPITPQTFEKVETIQRRQLKKRITLPKGKILKTETSQCDQPSSFVEKKSTAASSRRVNTQNSQSKFVQTIRSSVNIQMRQEAVSNEINTPQTIIKSPKSSILPKSLRIKRKILSFQVSQSPTKTFDISWTPQKTPKSNF